MDSATNYQIKGYKRVFAILGLSSSVIIALVAILVLGLIMFAVGTKGISTVALLLVVILVLVFAFSVFLLGKQDKNTAKIIFFLMAMLAILSFFKHEDFIGFFAILAISSTLIVIAYLSLFRAASNSYSISIALSFLLANTVWFLSEVSGLVLVQSLAFLFLLLVLLYTLFKRSDTHFIKVLPMVMFINCGLFYFFFSQLWVNESLFNISSSFWLLPWFLLLGAAIISIIKTFAVSARKDFLILIWSGLVFLEVVASYIPPGSGSLLFLAWPFFLIINLSVILLAELKLAPSLSK